ncbi:hypothetical protein [Serratia quinivorans]|uniref:hypothetical protein n=1 Tax=Serratia quinivorans TaxID=137545 RepID=UPI003981B8E0
MTADSMALWSMLGTWFAGVMALLTLFIANKALNTWREQEQTKAKMEFKKSLLALRNLLIIMPESWIKAQLVLGEKLKNASEYARTMNHEDMEVAHNLFAFTQAMNHANDSWVMCEHLFDGSKVATNWTNAQTCMNSYIQNRKGKNDVFEALNSLYSMRFVFEHK